MNPSATFEFSNRNAANNESVQRGVFEDPGGKLLRRQAPQVFFNHWTQIKCGAGWFDLLAGKSDKAVFPIGAPFASDFHQLTAKIKFRSGCPFLAIGNALSRFLQLLLQPRGISFSKPSRLSL